MLEKSPAQPDYVITAEILRQIGDGHGTEGRRAVRNWIKRHVNAKPVTGPTEKPASVRIATMADENALFHLMMMDAKENALPIATVSADRVLEHIQFGTRRHERPNSPMAILAMIDGPEGEPVGCMLLMFFQWWWSKAYFLQEIWNYVHPDHRASRHAENLMKFARWCSDDMSAGFGYRVWLLQGVTSLQNVEKKVAFYGQHGNYVGSFFLYPDPHGGSEK
jgi:hypothetical protein